MALVLSEEQQALQEVARKLVQSKSPVNALRALRDARSEEGFSGELWQEMVELGWAGILVPEEHGGAGLGYRELGFVLQECGRQLVASPLFSTALLGVTALNVAGSAKQRASRLPAVAAGEMLLALAHEEHSRHGGLRIACRAERSGGGFRLSGEKRFVLDGHVANALIVSARTSGAETEPDGITLFLVDAGAQGVHITRTHMVDSHNAALVRLDGVELGAESLLGAEGKGAPALRRILDAGCAGVAAQMLGGAEEAFRRTVDYLKQRTQFGVPIGSFQALQHRAARMFCELELAKTVVLDALSALDEDRADASAAVSVAKAHLSETFHLVSNEAIQMHGGIGMTDEHEIGFFLKRARVLAQTFGDATFHAGRFAELNGY
jgi:alkylation response protein AidB-like acyl-CoA dehydrogenase